MDHRLHLTQQAERSDSHHKPMSTAPDAEPSSELPAAPSIREATVQRPLFQILPPLAAPHTIENTVPTLAIGVKRSAADAGLDADAVPDGKRIKVSHMTLPDTERFKEALPDARVLAVRHKRTASDAGLVEDDASATKRLRQDEPIRLNSQVQSMITDSGTSSQERTPAQDTSPGATFAVDEEVQQQSEEMFLDMTDIWLSAHRGDMQTIQAWLEKPGTDVNALCAELGTVLHAVDSNFRPFPHFYYSSDDSDSTDSSTDDRLKASEERHGLPECRHSPSLLTLLLSRPGIDANTKNARGETALMSAVRSGHLHNVQSLLAWQGIDLAARTRSDETALAIVTEKTPLSIVEALLAALGINASSQQYLDRHREFTAAAATGDLAQVRSLIAETPWININFVVNGKSALKSAAKNAHLETVLALLAMPGIYFGYCDAEPLARLAIEKSHFQLLGDMLDRPRFYHIQQADFFYPYLRLAAANGCCPIVRMLLSTPEINRNVGNDKGGNALFDATINEHDQIVIVLVAMPWINVNVSTSGPYNRGKYHGYSVLMVAAENGNSFLVRALLAVPTIDVNLANESGHTPLMLAAYHGHLEIVQALLAKPGIDIKKMSQYIPYSGDSPEHISGARVRRSPFAPRTYYNALRLAKMSNEQQIIEALQGSVRSASSMLGKIDNPITEETYFLLRQILHPISGEDAPTSSLSPHRERLDPQRASRLEQNCMDISLGTCLASDVQRLLQSTIPLPAWCQSSLANAIALGFTAGHYRTAPAAPWRTLLETRAWLTGLAFGARQSRQDVIELDTGISHQLESMNLWNVFLNAVEDLQQLKADPDSGQLDELTLLGCAAFDGDLPMIKTLVALGANIHLRSPNGDVPIVVAAKAHQWAACAELLSLGAMPVMGDSKGYPALYHIASAFAYLETATPALAMLIRYLRLKNVRFEIPAPNPDEQDRGKNPSVLISDILFSNPESWIRFGKTIYGIEDEPLPATAPPSPVHQSMALKMDVHAMVQLANAEAALAAWLDEDPQRLHWCDPDDGQGLLHLAAAHQHVGLVRLLLNRGITRTHVDHAGQTAAQLLPADYMSSYTPAARAIADLLR